MDEKEKPLDDEAQVRIIFEHFRNLLVAIAVSGAGFWLQSHIRDGWLRYWDSFSAYLVTGVGLSLLSMNQLYLGRQLRYSRWAGWVHAIFGLLYIVVITGVVRYFDSAR